MKVTRDSYKDAMGFSTQKALIWKGLSLPARTLSWPRLSCLCLALLCSTAVVSVSALDWDGLEVAPVVGSGGKCHRHLRGKGAKHPLKMSLCSEVGQRGGPWPQHHC